MVSEMNNSIDWLISDLNYPNKTQRGKKELQMKTGKTWNIITMV